MGKQVWQPMRLAYVGHVAEALRFRGFDRRALA